MTKKKKYTIKHEECWRDSVSHSLIGVCHNFCLNELFDDHNQSTQRKSQTKSSIIIDFSCLCEFRQESESVPL